jgi:hypothetical protein
MERISQIQLPSPEMETGQHSSLTTFLATTECNRPLFKFSLYNISNQ